jgi:hypothetical protein
MGSGSSGELARFVAAGGCRVPHAAVGTNGRRSELGPLVGNQEVAETFAGAGRVFWWQDACKPQRGRSGFQGDVRDTAPARLAGGQLRFPNSETVFEAYA